jgi:hypothetical protein
MKQDEGERRNGQEKDEASPQEFRRFAELTRRLLAVPKAEIDEKVEQWRQGRRKRRPS